MFKWNQVLVLVAGVSLYFYTRRQSIYVTKQVYKEYDYIIVGGGTAGCVVAARLAEDPNNTVLVLEAGPAEFPGTEFPSNHALFHGSEIDWKMRPEPEEHCCKGLKEQRTFWPRGKVLGGTSTINAMIYQRGSRHDFDAWETQGCEGWGFDDVLPYFIKSEANQNKILAKSGYHGTAGPLKVNDMTYGKIAELFIQAGMELGYPVTDHNGEEQIGFHGTQSTSHKGVRMSTAESFIKGNSQKTNLHISTDSHVTKVLVESKRAVGVEFILGKETKKVYSRKEVIVSAGTVQSPQILMLSGIGPKEELEKHNIKVESDLPVGKNLQNHTITQLLFNVNEPITYTDDKVSSWKTKLQYNLFGTGIMTALVAPSTAFVKSPLQPENDKYPYIQVILFPSNVGSSQLRSHFRDNWFNMRKDVFDEIFGNTMGEEGFVIGVVLLHPHSRGKITLRSTNPFDLPVIKTNYFEDARDAEYIADLITSLIMTFESTEAYKSVGAKLSRTVYSDCKDYDWGSKDYWRCYVKDQTMHFMHQAGTCKMGPANETSTVVDPRLKVKGIEGLRVADASIMPVVVSAPTMASSIMIGEKAASIIIQDNNKLINHY